MKGLKFLLILSASFILTSCSNVNINIDNSNEDNPSLNEDDSENQNEHSLKINIEGNGTISLYLNGNSITETNFESSTNVGDSITITVSPEVGYRLKSIHFNNTLLTTNSTRYTFLVTKGENVLDVIFEEIPANPSYFSYEIVNNEAEVVSFNALQTELPNPVVIPDEVEINNQTYSVTSIASSAFAGSEIQSIRLGKNIKNVDDEAFIDARILNNIYVDEDNTYFTSDNGILYKGNSLYRVPIDYKAKDIVVKNGTKYINDHALEDCINIVNVTLPEGLEMIGNYSFADCSYLTKCNLPSTLTSIGDYAFRYTNTLTSITFNENLETIGEGAFYSSKISTLTLNSKLKVIPLYAFYYCQELSIINFAEGLEEIGDQAFISNQLKSIEFPSTLRKIGKSAFELSDSLTDVKFNEGLEEIGDLAFSRANNINAINLPSSLKTIGINPFSGITRIGYREDSFTISENNPYFEIKDGVLFSKQSDKSLVTYPYGLVTTTYTIPEGTKVIAQDSFLYQNYLLEVTIPTSVTDINEAFRSMYSEIENNTNTLTVKYLGTIEQFKQIDLHGLNGEWHEGTTLTNSSVICTDGTLRVI